MIEPIDFTRPLTGRRFDFNQDELSALELNGRTADKVNEVIAAQNTVDGKIAKKEDAANIAYSRKLSENGDFTGTLAGRAALTVVAQVDSTQDKFSYLAGQFSQGQTGQVLDGGFFENTNVKNNYDGGKF